MKKKSIALMAIAVLMVASIATAYTLAYFTDKDEKKNTFTVGNVDITLAEPHWAGTEKDPAVKADPGVVIPKDPTITNDGKNDAYVRMIVTINHSKVFTDAGIEPKDILGKFNPNNVWNVKEAPAGTDGNTDSKNYICYYQQPLKHGETTGPLFENVKIPAGFGNKQMADLQGFIITVYAEAIQADGFTADQATGKTAADAAFDALNAKAAEKASS